jgi:hypothetical protein
VRCPDEEQILLDELGELKVHDSRALDGHTASCPGCRQRRERLRALLVELGEAARHLPDDRGAFRARVQAAMSAPTRPAAAAPGSPWPLRRPGWALAAAAVALMPAVLLLRPDRVTTPTEGRFTARGPVLAPASRADVLLVRARKLAEVAGQTIGPDDALAVRVGNGEDRELYLLAFGRDAAGEVHWFFPAYRDPGDDPAALRIDRQSPARVLDELVLPERPAIGPLRLATVLAPGALTVKQVERRLAAVPPGAPLAPLFPGSIISEWTARWEDAK